MLINKHFDETRVVLPRSCRERKNRQREKERREELKFFRWVCESQRHTGAVSLQLSLTFSNKTSHYQLSFTTARVRTTPPLYPFSNILLLPMPHAVILNNLKWLVWVCVCTGSQLTCSAHIIFDVIHAVFEHTVQIVSAGFVFIRFCPLSTRFYLPLMTEQPEKTSEKNRGRQAPAFLSNKC